jgi:hypothetical protein
MPLATFLLCWSSYWSGIQIMMFLLCSFVHHRVISSLTGTNFFLSTLFQILNYFVEVKKVESSQKKNRSLYMLRTWQPLSVEIKYVLANEVLRATKVLNVQMMCDNGTSFSCKSVKKNLVSNCLCKIYLCAYVWMKLWHWISESWQKKIAAVFPFSGLGWLHSQ